MNNLEEIVELVMRSYSAHSATAYRHHEFELEVRRALMKRFCNDSSKKEHTYTITPPNLMGSWTTTQARTMGIPPTITGPNKEILNG